MSPTSYQAAPPRTITIAEQENSVKLGYRETKRRCMGRCRPYPTILISSTSYGRLPQDDFISALAKPLTQELFKNLSSNKSCVLITKSIAPWATTTICLAEIYRKCGME